MSEVLHILRLVLGDVRMASLKYDIPLLSKELGALRMKNGSETHGISPKIAKEKETVEKMIRLYCEKKHNSPKGSLCSDCGDLLEYSLLRLDNCQYQEGKPTCRKCPVHCYRPTKREEIRRVMRFSGPRLALSAPMDWIRHQLHDRTDVDSTKDE